MPKTTSRHYSRPVPATTSKRAGTSSSVISTHAQGRPTAVTTTGGRRTQTRQVLSAPVPVAAALDTKPQTTITGRSRSVNDPLTATEKIGILPSILPKSYDPTNPILSPSAEHRFEQTATTTASGSTSPSVQAQTTKQATQIKNDTFDFQYRNVYSTPSTRSRSAGGSASAVTVARGRATVGSGSGVGSGMGACVVM